MIIICFLQFSCSGTPTSFESRMNELANEEKYSNYIKRTNADCGVFFKKSYFTSSVGTWAMPRAGFSSKFYDWRGKDSFYNCFRTKSGMEQIKNKLCKQQFDKLELQHE